MNLECLFFSRLFAFIKQRRQRERDGRGMSSVFLVNRRKYKCYQGLPTKCTSRDLGISSILLYTIESIENNFVGVKSGGGRGGHKTVFVQLSLCSAYFPGVTDLRIQCHPSTLHPPVPPASREKLSETAGGKE